MHNGFGIYIISPWISSITLTLKEKAGIKIQKSMFLITMNVSLASFQLPNITLLYLDPYNNTFGEEERFVVFCTVILFILSIFLTFLMLGIVMFVKYGIEDAENNKLLDELISFAMITSIFMLLPASILMTYRNVFGPLPSIFVTKILLNVQIVCPERFK